VKILGTTVSLENELTVEKLEHTMQVLFFSITFLFDLVDCVGTEFDKIFCSSDICAFLSRGLLAVGCCGHGQKGNVYSRPASTVEHRFTAHSVGMC
jgi:hypothetical protein